MFIFIPKVGTRLEVLSLPRNSPRTEFTASLHCVYFRMTHNWEWTRRACGPGPSHRRVVPGGGHGGQGGIVLAASAAHRRKAFLNFAFIDPLFRITALSAGVPYPREETERLK